jgi:DNA polymerase-3 subunit delta
VEYGALLREVERGQIPPVALLHGGESLLLDDAIRLVSRALFSDASMTAFDREILDGRETSPESIARSASTAPFMAPRRLVVVRHAEALPPRQHEALVAYLRAPSDTTCLLLLATESLRADRTRKADHWLLAAAGVSAIVETARAKGRALELALRQRARMDGLDVAAAAARLLVQFVGDDLALLLAEAHKAALAGGPDNRSVGVGEVGAVVGEHRLHELFDLTRAIERGEQGRALELLERLLGAGEEPLRILGLLTTDLRTIWSVKDWSIRGQSPEQVERRLHRPRPVVERLLARAGTLAAGAMAHRLERCWQVEHRIKSGGEPRAEMALLIADLC